MTTKRTKGESLHKLFLRVAKAEVRHHLEVEEGVQCFNLYTYLNALENRFESVMGHSKYPGGTFQLSAHDVARYLWCCVATESGDSPSSHTFRGMPILD